MYYAPSDMYGAGAGVPMVQPALGQSQYPPQFTSVASPGFNYAAPQSGIGFIPQGGIGSPIAGAIGALPAMGMGIGVAAGIGSLFSSSPLLAGLSFLDPTAAGGTTAMARFAAMRAGGAGFGAALGGGIMAGALPLAAGAVVAGGAMYTGQQFMRGAQEYNQVGAQLSGLQFANPMASNFRGFGPGQVRQITTMMREFEAADPFTTMRDLNQMMDKFNEFGISQGVQNAKEFGKKFTAFVDAIRDIATEMGTNLQDASQLFGRMRGAGFYTSADVMGNTRSMQVARGLGMDQDTFLGMQQGAAGITRGAQMSGMAGARTAGLFSRDMLMGATSRGSGGLGLFSGEELMDITGAPTAAAAAAQMGGRFTGLITNFLRNTGTGKALLAGVGQMRNGRFTGEVDEGLLSDFASGGVSLGELSRSAGPRLRRPGAQVSFLTNQAGLASSLLEAEDGVEAALSGIEQEAHKWSQGRNIGADDAVRLFLEKVVGADELMAEKVADFMKHRNELYAAGMQRMRAEQMASGMQLEISRNRTLSGLKQRLGGTISGMFAPVRQSATDFSAVVEGATQGAVDSIFGVSRGGISQGTRDDYALQFGTGNLRYNAMNEQYQLNRQDVSYGTAASFLAESRGMGAAAEFRNQLLSGGDVGAGDLGFEFAAGKKFGMTDAQKSALTGILSRYSQAKFRGDDDAAEAALAEFKSASEGMLEPITRQGQTGPGGGYSRSTRGVAKVRAMTAGMAAQLGSQDVARKIALEGTIGKLGAYKDVESLRTDTENTALRYMGAGADNAGLAKRLRSGTGAARVLAAMGRTGTGPETGLAAWNKAITSKEFLGAKSEEEQTRILNRILSEEGVGSGTFSQEELGETMDIMDRVRTKSLAESVGGPSWVGSLMDASGMFPETSLQGYAARQKDLISAVTKSTDRALEASAASALQGNLATAPGEVKAALGAAWKDLEGATSVGELSAAAEGVLNKVEAGVLKGVRGGKELQAIGEQMTRMRRGGLESIAKAFGYDDTDAFSKFASQRLGVELGDKDGMSRADREDMIRTFGLAHVYGSLTSGAGGGTFLRGETHEQRMAIQMDATAVAVQKMSEVVDVLYKKAGLPDHTKASKTAEGENE
jgi:hypothetical protein